MLDLLSFADASEKFCPTWTRGLVLRGKCRFSFQPQVQERYDNSRVASCQLRVASCQLRVVSCELSVASCELSVASCQLRVGFYFASCELRVESCELRVASWFYIISIHSILLF